MVGIDQHELRFDPTQDVQVGLCVRDQRLPEVVLVDIAGSGVGVLQEIPEERVQFAYFEHPSPVKLAPQIRQAPMLPAREAGWEM